MLSENCWELCRKRIGGILIGKDEDYIETKWISDKQIQPGRHEHTVLHQANDQLNVGLSAVCQRSLVGSRDRDC